MLHLTSPWVTLSWYIIIYLDLFMNPAGVQKQCWPLTSTLGTFSLAKGCKRLQSLAQRSSPWSLRWLWRSSRVQDIQDGYMMGWLIKHQSGFLISRSFDLLICFDPAVKTAWSVLGKQPSAAGNAALMPFEFGHLGMEENAENHHAAAPSLMDLCPAQETVVA